MRSLDINESTDNPVINLALDTIKIGKQGFIFVNTKPSAEKAAEDIARLVKVEDKKLDELSEAVLKALGRPTRQCERLAKCVKKGIAFHHAGLTYKQRELIEEEFRKGSIKLICCTPTLAAGVDLPAFRAIIKDLKRYEGRGLNWIPVLEYLQQSGRAGRPSFDSYGESIIISSTKPEREKLEEKYVFGEPEEIESKLAAEPVLRTHLLSLIASSFVQTRKEVMDFFSKTFWAHQYKNIEMLEAIISKLLGLLEEWEFIITKGTDFTPADSLDEDQKIRATIPGKRVAELYLDPLTANQLITGIRKSQARAVTAFSFLQLVSSTLEMRPLLNVRMKEYEMIQEKIAEHDSNLLQDEPSMYEEGYEDFTKSIKTALFFNEWINEKPEDELLESFNIRPGEIRIKLEKAEWLLYSAQELSGLMNYKHLIKEIVKLRLRLKNGVREELLPLIKLRNIGRVRARSLFNNRIRSIKDIREADLATLSYLIGRQTALDIKRQVGQELSDEKIQAKPNKRKGQISLGDY